MFDELIGAIGNASYFHIGGDEAVFDEWVASADVTAYQHSLGLGVPSDRQAVVWGE